MLVIPLIFFIVFSAVRQKVGYVKPVKVFDRRVKSKRVLCGLAESVQWPAQSNFRNKLFSKIWLHIIDKITPMLLLG